MPHLEKIDDSLVLCRGQKCSSFESALGPSTEKNISKNKIESNKMLEESA